MYFKTIFQQSLLPLGIMIVLTLVGTGLSYYSATLTINALGGIFEQGIVENDFVGIGQPQAPLQADASSSLGTIQLVGLVQLLVGVISIAVVVWSGYRVGKKTGSTLAGAVSGLFIMVVASLIGSVLNLLLIVPLYSSIGGNAGGLIAAAGAALGIIGLVIGLVIAAVLGILFGAIGGFIGKRGYKQEFAQISQDKWPQTTAPFSGQSATFDEQKIRKIVSVIFPSKDDFSTQEIVMVLKEKNYSDEEIKEVLKRLGKSAS